MVPNALRICTLVSGVELVPGVSCIFSVLCFATGSVVAYREDPPSCKRRSPLARAYPAAPPPHPAFALHMGYTEWQDRTGDCDWLYGTWLDIMPGIISRMTILSPSFLMTRLIRRPGLWRVY